MNSAGLHYAINEQKARRNRIIKRRARRGWSTSKLAEHYGMSQPAAWRVVNNPNSGQVKNGKAK